MSSNNIYVGIDLHKRSFSFVMLNSVGSRLKEGRYEVELGAVRAFASGLDARHHVALEPLNNSYWFLDQLRPYVGHIHLANPYKVRLIAESRLKNDRIDAWVLADLLRVGYLPTVYIPSPEVMVWRRLVANHIRLVRDRTRWRNRILDLVAGEGLRITVKDAFGKRGRMELDQLPLSSQSRQFVDDMLVSHDLLTSQLERVDTEIERVNDGDPICTLLRTIDGIASFTALAVRATVGEMSRFRSPKAFGSYTGLVPGYRQSGDKTYNGSITKQGASLLRWVLLQGVNHFKRKNERLERLYQRLCFRGSVAKARVAVAHAMARIIYHVWTEARPYYRSQ